MEYEDKLLREISAIISAYNNCEIEKTETENEEQVVLRLVKHAVEDYLETGNE